MKMILNTTIAMMALSLTGCASPGTRTTSTSGRVIEFRSGPEGFDTRTFFYEGEQEVIAFDSQFTPSLAKASIAHLRKFTQKPITWLVITHPNPDKFNGTSVFKAEGARIIASAATAEAIPSVHAYKEYFFVEMAKMFKKGDYPALASIDQTFTGNTDLVLRGGERIHLHELAKPGVSSTQTVAYIEEANALMVGDLIHFKSHAWLEGGIIGDKASPTVDGWIADLKELTKTFPQDSKVFGGRGETTDLTTAVKAQVEYLKQSPKIIREQLKATPIEKMDYKALTKRFEKAFPDYTLGYLIEYGAYGLTQQVATQK